MRIGGVVPNLRAAVKRVTGATRHRRVTAAGWSQIPPPSWVKIKGDGVGFFLLRYDERNQGTSDTWHHTLDEAKHQATFEFEIEEGDWSEVTD